MTRKVQHGTVAWFDMVGREIVKAAAQLGLPRDLCLSVIERYIDGAMLEDDLAQGLRIDVIDGALARRTGVHPGEMADVLIEVTVQTARQLNLLLRADPAYPRALEDAFSQGTLRVSGQLGPLAEVFDMAHDGIVGNTT